MKKMTKRDYFTAILEKYPLTADEKAFVEHELELLAKKNASDKKPTERQKQNADIGSAVVEGMTPNRLYTITELLKAIPGIPEDMTNQRLTHIVTALVNEGKLTKTVEKRKSFFSLS